MTTRFTNLEALIPFARLRSQRGTYNGLVTPLSRHYVNNLCRHEWAISPEVSALIIFTRDTGHHTSGWWKNPDYERCWHLSLSYQASALQQHLEHDKARSQLLAEAFYGDDVRHCWIEGPYSPEGKVAHVWHYRVFADAGWQAIKPRGEVYNTEFTPLGWKSFSDVHGYTPRKDQAPFLLEIGR
jgi:hypothetical protein